MMQSPSWQSGLREMINYHPALELIKGLISQLIAPLSTNPTSLKDTESDDKRRSEMCKQKQKPRADRLPQSLRPVTISICLWKTAFPVVLWLSHCPESLWLSDPMRQVIYLKKTAVGSEAPTFSVQPLEALELTHFLCAYFHTSAGTFFTKPCSAFWLMMLEAEKHWYLYSSNNKVCYPLWFFVNSWISKRKIIFFCENLWKVRPQVKEKLFQVKIPCQRGVFNSF